MYMLEIYSAGFRDEIAFLLKLQESMPSFSVEKTRGKYASLDYVIKHEKTETPFLFMELKSRNIDLSKYDTLLMGRIKLENVVNVKQHIILIWICKTTETLYYRFYHKNLLDLKTHMLNSKRVVYINKRLCSTGYDNLIQDIRECGEL